jgi:DNA-binding transcriptional LysR family regulator
MRPTFVQLEAFYWIARLGSVKEAARHLNVTPPTISLRIDQLESELGSPMFERAGRGLALTPRGEALVPRVAAVIEQYGQIREAVSGEGQHIGLLRVGVTETFAQACLPAFMRAIGLRHPSLQFEFVVRTSAELEQEVLERRLDVTFAINPTGDPKLTLVPLGIQPVTWAAAPSFKLPSPLHPGHLEGVLVITNPHPAPMWRQITDWFRQDGLEPSLVCRCSSPIVVARLVTEGLGVSLLPRLLVQPAIESGVVSEFASGVVLHPSRMFAVYRFAEGSRFMLEVIDLGRLIMTEAKLIDATAAPNSYLGIQGNQGEDRRSSYLK